VKADVVGPLLQRSCAACCLSWVAYNNSATSLHDSSQVSGHPSGNSQLWCMYSCKEQTHCSSYTLHRQAASSTLSASCNIKLLLWACPCRSAAAQLGVHQRAESTLHTMTDKTIAIIIMLDCCKFLLKMSNQWHTSIERHMPSSFCNHPSCVSSCVGIRSPKVPATSCKLLNSYEQC
jgi:hypothetical protein